MRTRLTAFLFNSLGAGLILASLGCAPNGHGGDASADGNVGPDAAAPAGCTSGPLVSCFPTANTVTPRVEVETVYPGAVAELGFGAGIMFAAFPHTEWCVDDASCQDAVGPCLVRREPGYSGIRQWGGSFRLEPIGSGLRSSPLFTVDGYPSAGQWRTMPIAISPGDEIAIVADEVEGREYFRQTLRQPPTITYLEPMWTGDAPAPLGLSVRVSPREPLRVAWRTGVEATVLVELGVLKQNVDRVQARCYFQASAGGGVVPSAVLARFESSPPTERYIRVATVDEVVRRVPNEITGNGPVTYAALNVAFRARLDLN